MNVQEQRGKSLAEAVAILVEKIHKSFPAVSTHPIPPYEDEDFTLEVRIPAEMDREEVMNECRERRSCPHVPRSEICVGNDLSLPG